MKPILFNTDMVRGLLDNRKTATRRVVKPQPRGHMAHITDGTTHGYFMDGNCQPYRPPYRPGDILYVRETWTRLLGSYLYKANQKPGMKNPGKWNPSIHMPREAARIFLRVTDVRVERLQDITEEQAQAEGLYKGWALTGRSTPACTARQAFMWVWDMTIKPADRSRYGWIANPWVWVIEFERISREEVMGSV